MGSAMAQGKTSYLQRSLPASQREVHATYACEPGRVARIRVFVPLRGWPSRASLLRLREGGDWNGTKPRACRASRRSKAHALKCLCLWTDCRDRYHSIGLVTPQASSTC